VFHMKDEESKEEYISPAVYLHWNGGPESVYAFLDELDRRKVRTTLSDPSYEFARFVHVIGDFMDDKVVVSPFSIGDYGAGGLSLGVWGPPEKIETEYLKDSQYNQGDNGIYVVTRGGPAGRIVRRWIGYGESFRELPTKEVEKERKAAYKHDYMVGKNSIPATFLKIRPKISSLG